MKKLMLMTAMIVFTGMAGFTQSFEKGSQAINLDIGFKHTAYNSNHYYGFIPSVSVSYEYGIVGVPMGSRLTGVVSVGGYMGWSSAKYDEDWDDAYYHYNTYMMAVRANYHFIFHDKFDPYAGVWVGAKINGGSWKGDGDHDDDWHPAKSAPGGGAYIGARWFFTEGFGVNVELGYLISVVNFGLTFKF